MNAHASTYVRSANNASAIHFWKLFEKLGVLPQHSLPTASSVKLPYTHACTHIHAYCIYCVCTHLYPLSLLSFHALSPCLVLSPHSTQYLVYLHIYTEIDMARLEFELSQACLYPLAYLRLCRINLPGTMRASRPLVVFAVGQDRSIVKIWEFLSWTNDLM